MHGVGNSYLRETHLTDVDFSLQYAVAIAK
jgi:hypothetical protein